MKQGIDCDLILDLFLQGGTTMMVDPLGLPDPGHPPSRGVCVILQLSLLPNLGVFSGYIYKLQR
ncbi:MAG: hypothetical protein ACTSRA_13260 [Promethearchaeota archaeon]